MDLKITKKNGDEFTLEDNDVIVKDIIVSSIPLRVEVEEIEGKNGSFDSGATYGARIITVPFEIKAYDLSDYPLLRDALFGIVVDVESYYIQEMRRPKILSYEFVDIHSPPKMDEESNNKLVDSKRYLVRLQNSIELEQMLLNGEGELIFVTTELPYAESTFTSKDIDGGLSYDTDIFSYGMGLSYEDEKAVYSGEVTESNNLKVYNPGNVDIEPFEVPIKITLKNVLGGADGFKLVNITNSTSITFNDETTPTDVIVYDGAIITKNDLQATDKAHLDYITLSVGWNEFKLERGNSLDLDIDTRFYYK